MTADEVKWQKGFIAGYRQKFGVNPYSIPRLPDSIKNKDANIYDVGFILGTRFGVDDSELLSSETNSDTPSHST